MTIGTWFRTDYDEPVPPAALPVELTSGTDPTATIFDQVLRGRGILGRVTGEFGAIGFKVGGRRSPLRLVLSVGLDEGSTRMWADRVRPSRLAPELPRLVTIRAQGRVRGALVLARRQGWRGAATATATLTFDLAAEERNDEGLVIVEVGAAALPEWAAGALSAQSAVGLRINSVRAWEVDPSGGAVGPGGFSGCDFTVIQPGAPTCFDVRTAAVPFAPPVARNPRNRVTRQKPTRAVVKLSRAGRRLAVRALPYVSRPLGDVRATDLLTGEPVAVYVHRHRGGTTIGFAEPIHGPVLLGSAQPQPTRSWQLTPTDDS